MSDLTMLLLTIGGLVLLMVIVLFLPHRIQRRNALVASMWCWVGVAVMHAMAMLMLNYAVLWAVTWSSVGAYLALMTHLILLPLVVLSPPENQSPMNDSGFSKDRNTTFKALYFQQRQELRALRQQLAALEDAATGSPDQDDPET